ncbi:hypothetical protein [Mesorhizobium sp.]|nr:hypothetical protein [Mesorhizobium sp.]
MAAAAATGTGMKAKVTELWSQTGQDSIFNGAVVIGANTITQQIARQGR